MFQKKKIILMGYAYRGISRETIAIKTRGAERSPKDQDNILAKPDEWIRSPRR
jgi:hypothetical protein